MIKKLSSYSRLYQISIFLVILSVIYYPIFTYLALFAPEGVILQYPWWNRALHVLVLSPVTLILGLFIIKRVPGNIIGPAVIVFQILGNAEIIFAVQQPIYQSALNAVLISTTAIPAFIIILSHFPTGEIYPRRIAPIVYALITGTVILGVLTLFGSPYAYGTEFTYGEARPNPFAIKSLLSIGSHAEEWGGVIASLTILATIVLQMYRYRHANMVERKQMRWLFFGVLLAMIPILFNLFMFPTLGDDHILTVIFLNASIIAIDGVIPITIAIGILFNRLWDIDVIIRRTLIYAVVSALLALTYFGIVLTTQTLLSGFIPEDNTLLIVASTLAIAALFNPLQQRVQRVIDRLFYRKRYDAEQILDSFQYKIQNEIAPQEIGNQVVQTIEETLQPEHLSLWIVEPHTDGS